MARAASAVLALAALLAGCTAAPAPAPSAGAPDGTPEDAAGNLTTPNATAPATPREAALYLTADHGLALQAPAEGFAQDRGTLPTFLTGQGTLPAWALRAPLPEGWRITAARLDVWFTSDAPQRESSSVLGFPPVIFWFGADGTWSPSMPFEGPDALQPGQVAQVGGELMLPPGGLVLERGSTPRALLALTYLQSDAAPLRILVGGNATASRVTLTVEAFEVPANLAVQEQAFDGAFAANSFLLPANPDPAQTVAAFPVELPAGVQRLEAMLDGAQPAGAQDLDLVLLDPTGAQVWSSTSPMPDEGLRLHAPNLPAAGTYTLEVRNFQSFQGTFTLAVRVAT